MAVMSTKRRQGVIAWAFALPFVLLFGAFTLVPPGVVVRDVVHRLPQRRRPDAVRGPVRRARPVRQAVPDPQFLRSLWTTAYFVIVGIPLTMGVALALAVALNSGITRFRTAFRTGF